MSSYDDHLKRYEDMVATQPDVQRKGKANPYTSLNGNMFSFIDKEGVISLRMSKEDCQRLKDEEGATDSIQYGATMREYVTIPEHLAADPDKLATLFQSSYAYAKTLKPTTKKKKA